MLCLVCAIFITSVCSHDKAIHVERRPIYTFTHGRAIRFLTESPANGDLIVLAGGKVTARHLKNAAKEIILTNDTDAVSPVSFCSDRLMAVVGKGNVTFWELPDYKLKSKINLESDTAFHYLYRIGRRTFIVGEPWRAPTLFAVDDAYRLMWRREDPTLEGASKLCVSADGNTVFVCYSVLDDRFGRPGQIKRLHWPERKLSQVVRFPNVEVSTFNVSKQNSLLFIGGEDGSANLHWIKKGLTERLKRGRNAITAVALSADETMVAYGDHDGTIVVKDLVNPGMSYTIEYHSESVTALAFVQGNNMLASGDRNGRIAVWPMPR